MQKLSAHPTPSRRWAPALGLALLFLILSSGLPALAANPQPGYTERVTVVNNCGSEVWMWSIPPGPDLAETQNQYWEPPINPGTRVCLAGSTADCTAIGTRAYMWKIAIPQGASQSINIPDVGAASFKIYFNMECTEGDSPFTQFGKCQIGGQFGNGPTPLGNELAGSNTWFEGTWGCNPVLDQNTCAVNPSSTTGARLNNQDNFDISFVDGYTIPVKVTLGAGEAGTHNCTVNGNYAWDGIDDSGFLDLFSCPSEDGNSIWTRDAVVANVLNTAGLSLLTMNPDNSGNAMNCVAPYEWFATSYLGQAVAGATRGIASSNDPNSLNEVNWYGCASTCGGTAYDPSCICPACQSSVCLQGPFRNGNKNVAKTNYVRGLKAMGVKAYSYQYDDYSGLKQCDWGAHITVTLCPARTGQQPWKPQYWQFNQVSNQCASVGEGTPTPGTYATQYQCVTENAAYGLFSENGVTYCVPTAGGKYSGYQECALQLHPDGAGTGLLLDGSNKSRGVGNWPTAPSSQSH